MNDAIEYEFLTPQRVVFGRGRRDRIGSLVQELGGTRAFVVCGSRTLERHGGLGDVIASLQGAGLEAVRLPVVSREPEVEDVDRATAFLREHGATAGDVVVAVGGGSALDLAKAAGALVTQTAGSVVEWLEGVGSGRQIERDPLPLVAVPTTGGTGSEVTKNAVVSSYGPPFKKSLRSDRMVPRLVLIDPELAVHVSQSTTAHTGMDAITQLVESYVSCRAKPVPRALALSGLELAAGPRGDAGAAVVEAVRDGGSLAARECMAHAALLSGWALANSGLGLAHGVAAALGVHCRVPHGLACAVLLPVALRVNRDVAMEPLARVGEVVTGKSWSTSAAATDAGIERIEELCAEIGIPRRLSEIGVELDAIPAIVTSSRGNSMSGNPRELSDAELTAVLEGIA